MADDDIEQEAAEILQLISLGDWSILVDDIAADLDDVYADGLAEGLRLTDMDVDVEHVHERAVAWAREQAASLVTMIEDNTRDLLLSTVVQALEERWSTVQLADEIADSAGFSDARSEMIARTEVLAAHNQGNLQGYRDAAQAGVRVMKQWLSDNDDECGDNSDEGPIELDEDFPSGDDAPPAHPNCRCSLAPYLPEEEEGGGGVEESDEE